VEYGGKPYIAEPDLVVQEIQAARSLDGTAGVPYGGVCLFKGGSLREQHIKALKEGPFTQPARLPWQEPGSGWRKARSR